MIEEPLLIRFSRTGGGHPEIHRTFDDVVLDADDQHAWLGTERPHIARPASHMPEVAQYKLEFRRGSERRVVSLTDDEMNAQLEPLINRLVHLAERS